MKIKVVVSAVVEVPEGATHYAGDLLDGPTWWKYSENSTGTYKGWSCYNGGGMDPGWYIGQQTTQPHWVKPISQLPAFTSVDIDVYTRFELQSVEVASGPASSDT